MNDADVDAAILAVVTPSWRKVAFIVGRAAKQVGNEFAARDDAYAVVALRIRLLVSEGRLRAQGNLVDWRFSEVKLP